jgi:hypothetical protein
MIRSHFPFIGFIVLFQVKRFELPDNDSVFPASCNQRDISKNKNPIQCYIQAIALSASLPYDLNSDSSAIPCWPVDMFIRAFSLTSPSSVSKSHFSAAPNSFLPPDAFPFQFAFISTIFIFTSPFNFICFLIPYFLIYGNIKIVFKVFIGWAVYC